MTRLRAISAALFLQACTAWSPARPPLLVPPGITVGRTLAEADPWTALAAIERRRAPVVEDASGALVRFAGRPGAHADVAWSYVRIGRAFALQSRFGAASRAFWAAIRHSHTALASEAERARIRAAAYAELAGLAETRGRQSRSAMLHVVSELSAEFVKREARRSDEAFGPLVADLGHELATLARIQADREAQSPRPSPFLCNPFDAAKVLGSAACQLIVAPLWEARIAQLESETRTALAATNDALAKLLDEPDATDPDHQPISDRRFLAGEMAHLLAIAADPAPYLARVAPLLGATVADATPGEPAAGMIPGLEQLEADVERAERDDYCSAIEQQK